MQGGTHSVTVCAVAADIPAGLGYLAAGLLAAAADIALVINRDGAAEWLSDQTNQQIDEGIAARDRAPRRTRWMYWRYRDARLHDAETRSKIDASAGGMWMGGAILLTLVAVVLIGSAVAEFTR